MILAAPIERNHQSEQAIKLQERFAAENGHAIAWLAHGIKNPFDDFPHFHFDVTT
jgi:hypothetical protein